MSYKERISNSDKAKNHVAYVCAKYGYDINYSVASAKEYRRDVDISDYSPMYDSTEVKVIGLPVQDALSRFYNGQDKIAILNFASYKRPGGKFIEGSIAQEECLCHASTLYPVLSNFTDRYYAKNLSSLNYGLYTNAALYCDNIVFTEDNIKCGVITCAAPNANVVRRYSLLSEDDITKAMRQRLEFVFKVAIVNNVDILFLGAYGCGVFRNDPYLVANLIKEFSEKYNGYFKTIVNPIPIGANLRIFEEVLT